MDQAQVEIHLVPDNSFFTVHREIICFYSGYFRKAFGGSFLEAEEKSVKLPDVTKDIFGVFQYWLYAQAMRLGECTPLDPEEEEEEEEEEFIEKFRKLQKESARLRASQVRPLRHMVGHIYSEFFLHLYVFADAYDVPQLRQDIMTLVVDLSEIFHLGQGMSLRLLEESLPENSQFAARVLEEMAIHFIEDMKEVTFPDLKHLPHGWLVKLVSIMTSKPKDRLLLESLEDDIRDSCRFHDHKNSKEKVLCRRNQAFDAHFHDKFRGIVLEQLNMQSELYLKDATKLGEEIKVKDDINVGEETKVEAETVAQS